MVAVVRGPARGRRWRRRWQPEIKIFFVLHTVERAGMQAHGSRSGTDLQLARELLVLRHLNERSGFCGR